MKQTKRRPHTANFRKVKRNRINPSNDPREILEFNPWSTVYMEANKQTQDKQRKSRVSENQTRLDDLLSVNTLKADTNTQNKGELPELKIDSKQNKPKKMSFFLKTTTNKRSSLNPVKKQSLKKSGLENRPLHTTNVLGQNEQYMDPEDAKHKPPHTRIVVNTDDKEFLSKNVQNLYKGKNEYYPMLGEECLCGECLCGKCKCVHFKFKPKKKNSHYLTNKVDFDEKKPIYNNKPIIRKPEMVRPVNKILKDTLYTNDYKAYDLNREEPQFEIKAKISHIGPSSTKTKAPMAKMTNHKLDYPNWGAQKVQSLKPNNRPLSTKKFPFTFKTQNQQYGGFFEEENVPPNERAPNQSHKLTNNFFGPNIPKNYDSQAKRDFGRLKKINVKKRLPKNNIFIQNEPFADKFRSITRDIGKDLQPEQCIVRDRIKELRVMMREFSDVNKIPL
jgi:hypothetical protein